MRTRMGCTVTVERVGAGVGVTVVQAGGKRETYACGADEAAELAGLLAGTVTWLYTRAEVLPMLAEAFELGCKHGDEPMREDGVAAIIDRATGGGRGE